MRALLRGCFRRLSLLLRLLDLGLLLRIRERSRGDRASRLRLLQRLDLVQYDQLLLLHRQLLLRNRNCGSDITVCADASCGTKAIPAAKMNFRIMRSSRVSWIAAHRGPASVG